MNLETVEQRCLSYLKEVSNPLVPVDTLLRHVRRDPDCADLTERELLEFLGEHELFKVIEAGGLGSEPERRESLAAAGLVAGPQVILSTRIPPPQALADMMSDELDTLASALVSAMKEAQSRDESGQEAEIKQLLHRVGELKKRLDELG